METASRSVGAWGYRVGEIGGVTSNGYEVSC